MEKQRSQKSILLKYAVLTAAVAVVAVFIVFKVENVGGEKTPREQVLAVLQNGLNPGNSLYTEEEIAGKIEEFEEKLSGVEAGSAVSVETVVDLGRMAQDVRDYETALALYSIADTMNPKDLFYQVEEGRIYLELGRWQQAAQVFEPMKVTWPVYEIYEGLAKAYQHIEDTPDYIVDSIYEEGLYVNMNRSELLQAYIKWLEKTGREKETIKYYELWNNQAPQQALQDKINELKQKYPDA